MYLSASKHELPVIQIILIHKEKIMRRREIYLLATALLFSTLLIGQEYPGFWVSGRHLYDRCGERVILRGVSNPNIWFERNGIPRYAEIKQTGANVVRIVWTTAGTPQELDEAISNCIDEQMIPMIELHDATGDFSKLQTCVDYWIDQDVTDILKKHEQYLLVNIGNEIGDGNVTGTTFRMGYESAISQMRLAGIRVPLIIDGTDWGKNINILQAEGPDLIEYDPDHNLIFSVHMWWPQMYGYTESSIVNEINQSVNMSLPLIVGEFSQMHGACEDDVITSENSIAYKTILKECQENQVGYIAWSWFGNCNPFWDMSTTGTFASLYDWGLEVAVSDENSIQNTSVLPYSIANGVCNPNSLTPDMINPGFQLYQNNPNPFASGTSIKYTLRTPSVVQLTVYNFLGEKVTDLVNEFQSPGTYEKEFDPSDLPYGIYFYSLMSNNIKLTKRMLLVN
jgi:mannan endo-1,4-beta-mannosidase